MPMRPRVIVLKGTGERESFDPTKLLQSLRRAGASRVASEKIVTHIEPELVNGMTTGDIYKHAHSFLIKTEKAIAARYSLRRAVMELGPTGFPFEDYVAQILKTRGFEALTRQVVMGGCVGHEVDVVAYNKEKLIMAETKFHNVSGLRSDIKVALYVKARFDDLSNNEFTYGVPAGGKRKLDEGWLVTNTKFTSTAIQYAQCAQTIKLIGWNYPVVGSLHDMIEEAALEPVTCLTGLTKLDKNGLMKKGIVLVRQLTPAVMAEFAFSKQKTKTLLEEIEMLRNLKTEV